jgi:hypothetical protein
MQKTRASSAMRTRTTEPRATPTIAPTDIPLSDSDGWPSEDEVLGAPDPGWVRFLWDLPEGGEVYGGGGGAGPLSKEFPLYLI